MLAFALMIGLLAPGEVITPSFAEAQRLAEDVQRRAGKPGGAVDMIRLARLTPWCPEGWVQQQLLEASQSRRMSPLNRGMALWLMREDALKRLDHRAAGHYADQLGLLTGFVMREGAAPNPAAPLEPTEWRPYPHHQGAGVLRLDAFMHPNRNTTGTLVTRLDAPEAGPAVLRVGYDDAIVVWLNGDEVYRSRESHQAFLDQAAIAIDLREGENRLMVEVQQRSGAWRFISRITDHEGTPLPVRSVPDPWGPTPEPMPDTIPDPITDLWHPLYSATETDPPDGQGLRDLAEYARISHLPNRDQTVIQVALEGGFDEVRSPRTLLSWLALLDEERRRAALARYGIPEALDDGDAFARLELRLQSAWNHYYARRLSKAWSEVESLLTEVPNYLPAQRLLTTLYEDLGWSHSAVHLLETLMATYPRRDGLAQALGHGYRSAGRSTDELALVRARVAAGRATLTEHYRLAHLEAFFGRTEEALDAQDRVLAARPAQWQQTVDGIEVLLDADRFDDAEQRINVLESLSPRSPLVATLAVRLAQRRGDQKAALARVEEALKVDGRDEGLRALKRGLSAQRPRPELGPPVKALERRPCGDAPAQVLYQHARTSVARDGRAERWIRRVIQLCNSLGVDRYRAVDIFHTPGSQVLEIIRARMLSGTREGSPLYSERTLSNEESRLYFDLRATRLTFENAGPGDLIEVVWRLADLEVDPAMPGEYGEVAYLQEEIPRAISIVEVTGEAQERVALGIVPQRLVEPGPVPLGGQTMGTVVREGSRVIARDVPGVELSERMPGATDVFAYIHLSTMTEWSDVESRYRALLGDRGQPSPSLSRHAERLTRGADSTEAVVERLYHAVVDRIRYVGLEFGIHSFQPSPAEDTWVRGYGDCKDKAVLLIALLRAVGVEAQFVLVRTRPEGSIAPTPASLAFFDHAMVYLPSLKRFVDPTVDQNAPWTLPSPDEGAQVLVIGEGGRLRTVERRPPEDHLVDLDVEMNFQKTGRGSGRVTWALKGAPALPTRRALEPRGSRLARANEHLGRWLEGVQLRSGDAVGLRPAMDPVIVTAAAALPFGGQIGLGAWPGIDALAIEATRRQDLVLPHLVKVHQRYRFTFPSGASLRFPDTSGMGDCTSKCAHSDRLESEFGVFERQLAFAGRTLSVELKFTLSETMIPRQAYGRFRDWLAAVREQRAERVEVRYAE